MLNLNNSPGNRISDLAPLIVLVRGNVEFLLDVMKLAVHVRDLGTEAAAVVVLRTAPELIVQLISFGANMLVLPPDVTMGAVAAHLALDMLEHPVEVMDFGVKPAASRLTVKLSVAGSLTVFLVK